MKYMFTVRQSIDIQGQIEAESEDEAQEIAEKISIDEVHFNYPAEVEDADIDVLDIEVDDITEV